MISTNIPT